MSDHEIEEIIVPGRRTPRDRTPPPWPGGRWPRTPPGRPPPGRPPPRPPQPPPQPPPPVIPEDDDGEGSLLPPVVPIVIQEIIVTAQRPAPAPPFTSTAGRAGSAFSLAAFWATAAGLLASQFMRRAGEQRLEEAWRGFESVQPRPPDSPVRTIEPEVMTEIIVTAQRQFARPDISQYIFFSPDVDPWIMQPVWPVFTQPMPAAVPRPIVDAPVSPLEIPTAFPSPFEFPLQFSPIPQVQALTSLETQTLLSPQQPPVELPPQTLVEPPPQVFHPPPQPIPVSPFQPQELLTGLLVGLSQLTPQLFPQRQLAAWPFPSPRADALPQPFPEPQRDKDCPPCAKTKQEEEVERERNECWKKLVKEGLTASLDSEYRWQRIDCNTGREL